MTNTVAHLEMRIIGMNIRLTKIRLVELRKYMVANKTAPTQHPVAPHQRRIMDMLEYEVLHANTLKDSDDIFALSELLMEAFDLETL